jgi:hypothetical protein
MRRLVFGKQLGRRSPSRLLLEIDIGKLLAVVVAHHKAAGLFFDAPRGPMTASLSAEKRT